MSNLTTITIPKTGKAATRYFSNEAVCVQLLSEIKWDGGEKCCIRCGSTAVYGMGTRPMFKCRDCKKQFSIKAGTIMESSPIPISDWFMAIWMLVNSKNGSSSLEISREVGVSPRTAWFMEHRIREALSQKSIVKIKTISEVDQTWIGGKADNMHKERRAKFKQGKKRITGHQTAVMGILERGGEVRAVAVENERSKTLYPILLKNVDKDAIIYTDTDSAYKKLKSLYKNHEMVNHKAKEYVRNACYTNGIENFWTLLKRSVDGTYIKLSKKHLNRYIVEQAFRYNTRKEKNDVRFRRALSHIFGKRLTWDDLVSRKSAA